MLGKFETGEPTDMCFYIFWVSLRTSLWRCPGMCLLDVGLIMAKEQAKNRGVPCHQLWLDIRTHKRLRDLAGATACLAWSLDGPCNFKALTERVLEKRFGRLRMSFPSSTMTVADYYRSSAKAMTTEIETFERKGQPPVAEEGVRLTEEEFTKVAEEAQAAALKLAAMCSDWTVKDLMSALSMDPASSVVEDDGKQNDPDEDEGRPSQSCVVFGEGMGWILTALMGVRTLNQLNTQSSCIPLGFNKRCCEKIGDYDGICIGFLLCFTSLCWPWALNQLNAQEFFYTFG